MDTTLFPVKKMSDFTLRHTSWDQDAALLKTVREEVFIKEQQVPIELEWDDEDKSCLHLLAIDHAEQPIGCARLLDSGQIGRMAVLPSWRGNGVGSALLAELIQTAQAERYPPLFLHAQVHVVAFYQKHGFQCIGEQFMEAGIPHITMQQ